MSTALSPLDSLFLHLESPRTPMHMGSIGVFEGAPLTDADGRVRIEELRRRVDTRLRLVPKLRQHLSSSPLMLLPRRWEDDPAFDIAAHVRQAAVPSPGSDAELLELSAEILSWPMCRARPLWELWVIEGLAGGRIAVLEKLHHSVADGLGGVELAAVLLDLERHPRPAAGEPEAWHPRRGTGLARLVAEDMASMAHDAGSRMGHRAAGVLHPRRVLCGAQSVVDGLRSLLTPAAALAPRCSLNAGVGRRRRVAVVRQRLASLRTVERWAGGSVNDVLLTAVAGGVRALHLARREPMHDLQVLLPVGTGHHGDLALGNAVSAMVVRLPLDEADPLACLRRVAAATASAKRHHQAAAATALIGELGLGLQPGIAAVAAVIHRQPFVNLVVTNVPGPDDSLYAMGARMLEAIPIVPIAGNLSMGVAAFSYHGQFTVGILADRDRCPDVDVMARGMDHTFRVLVRRARAASAGGERRDPEPAAVSAATRAS